MSSLASELLHSPARPRSVLQAVATCIVVAGALVIAGWHAHWTALLQVAPGAASMKYNTALCFILCGLAAGLLTEAAHVDDPALIQPIRERFSAAAATIERSLKALPQSPQGRPP